MTAKISSNRLQNMGRLSELKNEAYRLRVMLDNMCKGVIDLFSPMDQALRYVEDINIPRLKVTVKDIEKKHNELKDLLAEIEALEGELGD